MLMTVEEIVQKHYEEIFKEVIDIIGDDMFEIKVSVETRDGFTATKSWLEREKRIEA